MDPCPRIWDFLHDAIVENVAGACPGTVEFWISGEHLRRKFPEPGDFFVLRLEGCSLLRFREYAREFPVITAFAELTDGELQILSADDRGEYCEVHCHPLSGRYGMGTLDVSAADVRLSLDSGREVGLDDLSAASKAYWSSFAAGNSAV